MQNDKRPAVPLPYEDLRDAIGDDAGARGELDALHAHLEGDVHDREQIAAHVDKLRGVREAGARIANWFDHPDTQRWFMTIADAGL